MNRFLSLGILVISACAGMSHSQQVRIRAANDLKCQSSQIQTTEVDKTTITASGCGQERTYVQQCTSANATHCNWISREAGSDVAGKPATVQQ